MIRICFLRQLFLAGLFFLTNHYFSILNAQVVDLSDSLNQILSSGLPDSLRLKALAELGDRYTRRTQYREAIAVFDSCAEIARRTNRLAEMGESLYRIGRTYWHQGKYTRALSYHHRALENFSAINDSASCAKIYNGLGSIHYFLNNYDQAYDNYLRSLRIREELGDSARIVIVLDNIGLVFQEWRQPHEALQYHEKALRIAQRIGYAYGIAYTHINLGLTFTIMGELERALEYYKSAYEYYLQDYTPDGMAYIFRYFGDVYEKMGQIPKAIEYYQRSYENAVLANNTYRVAFAQHDLGRLFDKIGDQESALEHINQSIETSRQENYRLLLQRNYYLRSAINSDMRNYFAALNDFKLAEAYKDSIFNEKKAAAFNDMELQYKLESKDKENRLLRNRLEVQHLRLRQQRLIGWSLAGTTMLICGLLVTIITAWRSTRRHNVRLSRQNDEIRNINREKEHLIQNLQEALENVKQLQSLLPICANCKKIRDDKGYWNNVESYISQHTGVQFSHGICPECMQKLYPEYYAKINKDASNANPLID